MYEYMFIVSISARDKLEAPAGRASPVHSPVSSEDSYVQSSK